jgi:long-subunit fatty acid transport protein
LPRSIVPTGRIPSGSATATGVIDHVVATNNDDGIGIDMFSADGLTTAAISNSVASNNSGNGIGVANNSAAIAVSIDNTDVSGNLTGIVAEGTPKVTLGRSVITANSGNGIDNGTSPNTFFSYKDNRINENGTDISSPLNYTVALQ